MYFNYFSESRTLINARQQLEVPFLYHKYTASYDHFTHFNTATCHTQQKQEFYF